MNHLIAPSRLETFLLELFMEERPEAVGKLANIANHKRLPTTLEAKNFPRSMRIAIYGCIIKNWILFSLPPPWHDKTLENVIQKFMQ